MLLRILAAWSRRLVQARSTRTPISASLPGPSTEQLVAEGLKFQKAGEIDLAESVYRKLLAHSPVEPNALHLLATIEHGRGRMDPAEELVRSALDIRPRTTEFLNTLGTILGDTGRPEEAFQVFSDVLKLDPGASLPRSNFLFLLNLLPDFPREAMLQEHLKWAQIHAEPLASSSFRSRAPESRPRAPESPIRIGYVSGDLWGGHPVGRICSSVLPHHDKNRFAVFYYNNTRSTDEVTSSLRANADSWADVRGIDDDALARRIQADNIDILVDLSGHTRNNRLLVFARRPARIHASWLGYLNTTGMRALDWRIVSAQAEPTGAERYHAERLWRLPGLPWPWTPPRATRDGDMDLPDQDLRGRPVVFGSFNAFKKLNSAVLSTWASILREVPKSKLRIYGVPEGASIDRTYDAFERAGIENSRVSLFGTIEYSRYLKAYGDVDISLDPFPYNGGATTCESLWMGVPVVTLAGTGGFGRTSACFLHHLGMNELIAETRDAYRATATRLANQLDSPYRRRELLRERVREGFSGSPQRFTRELESAYLGMLTEVPSNNPATC